VVLISGQRAVVTAVRKTQYLKAGDLFIEVVNTMHYGINQRKVSVKRVVFYAGVINTPKTIVEKER
jgi:hypothetical protein